MPTVRDAELSVDQHRKLTSAKASKRGMWSHLRKPSDLAQRITSAELSSATRGNNSEAIRWKT